MKRTTMERGSALLIVLGMLSFMVVSAVGFAVFMRQSRAPSGYLRRTSSSRYLLKAALANAIARLDGCFDETRQRCEGVYDDPYPGVGPSQKEPLDSNGDYWANRVFTPFGPVGPEETVSTLTLEGLAYLPPAIINEARLSTRRTRTATWKNLSYDMGRYAFSAIDVSDCFDINKLYAGERRTSAPNQRVNLSSLFPDNGQELDGVLDRCGDIPFVSLADFNIVAGDSKFSPFCSYVRSGDDASIYREGDADGVKNALFATDTWFPPTNRAASAATVIDLAGKRPFPDMNVKNFPDIDNNGNELYNVLMANIGGVGLACLYDYLDADRVPLSLALPTVETQPMICGLTASPSECLLRFDASAGAKDNTVEVEEGGATYEVLRKIEPYRLTIESATLAVSGVAAFPFKRVSSERKGSWKVETLAAVFFAQDDLKARVAADSLLRPKKAYWDSCPNVKAAGGVIWVKGETGLSFPDNIRRTEDALQTFDVQIRLPKVELGVFCKVVEKKTQKVSPGQSQPPPLYDWSDSPKYTTDEMRGAPDGALVVLDADGREAAWQTAYFNGYREKVNIEDGDLKASHGEGSQNFQELSNATQLRPYVAVWARVKDGGDVVDLAPATCEDDEAYLPGANYSDLRDEIFKMSGDRTPLLDFRLDHAFTFDVANDGFSALADGQPLEAVDWKSLYAPDPRYNFAPEDWFGTMDEDASKENWQRIVRESYLGKGGRDPDIFMFTSDQEYLQSISELAFLPYVQEMNGRASFFEGDFMGSARYHGRNDFHRRSAGGGEGFANGGRFWKTYTAVDQGGGSDPIYEMSDNGRRYEIVSGTGDFRANPFSTDSRVLKAVLKDTPYDWYVASTNEEGGVNPTLGKQPADRASWAFCEASTVAKLTDAELDDLADRMRAVFGAAAANGQASWQKVFDESLKWYSGNVGDEQKSLFGLEDFEEPLHGVDRKFLHGFWRECFQNRQQLFLVFIRAEPLTVGGSGAHTVGNAQLGARGVALVWRDPAPPEKGGPRPPRTSLTGLGSWEEYYKTFAPHRTRVLFYHQFD